MTIFTAVIVALGIFVFFRLFNRLLLSMEKRQVFWRKFSYLIVGVELIVWFLWLFWVMYYFVRDEIVYSYLTIVVLLFVLGMITWFVLRDVVAGVIFKFQHNLKVNQSVHIANITGKIIRAGSTSLVLESGGEQLKVPYTRLINKTVGQFQASEVINHYNFDLKVPKSTSKDVWVTQLRSQVLLLPWSAVKKPPVIHFRTEEQEVYVFDLRVYALSERHAGLIEQHLHQLYYPTQA